MTLSIFDLDNTLIDGDSDYLWGQFLVDNNIVDGQLYEQKNQEFYDQYKQGTLDIQEFLRFSLKPLSEHPTEQLLQWRKAFMLEKIQPIILDKAVDLVEHHRQSGNILMIITATNHFVTQPIAEYFDVEYLLATNPEMIGGKYTGKVEGIPCFQDGKVIRLQKWLDTHDADLNDSWFYSDSHNDIPLLEKVSHAIAVDPDDSLREHATTQQWDIISLRE
ncbi:MAG: HAD family hydrolase [Gammaproteobacteria bacterium]|nr:HAD family hydrolase [Gammaproteobacteria bacterium]